jgi:hypothetical protein
MVDGGGLDGTGEEGCKESGGGIFRRFGHVYYFAMVEGSV